MPYADISSVQEKTGRDTKYTELSIFTKKGNPMAGELEKNLQELWKDGTLKALSQKYFEKDITLKLQEKKWKIVVKKEEKHGNMPYASPLFLYKITTDFSKKQLDFLKKEW